MNILKIVFEGKEVAVEVDPTDNTLTEREIKIVELVAAGKRNNEIATTLVISEKGVKDCLKALFNKFEVSDRLELALYVIHHRLIPIAQDRPNPAVTQSREERMSQRRPRPLLS